MNNQSNNDYDKDLSWSENPASNLNVDSENDYDYDDDGNRSCETWGKVGGYRAYYSILC